MLKNHKLLIDQDCHMCRLYSKPIVHLGMTDKNCILPYQSPEAGLLKNLDQDRARNEIALLDLSTGTATYGLASLIKILTHNHHRIQALLHHPLFFKPMTILYRFISYNRKVIAPAAPHSDGRDCNPDFNLSYRWVYIIFVALATALIVNNFTAQLFPHFGWPHNLTTELVICFGQVAWQAIAAQLIIGKDRTHYLGNMSTVSMMGALLLLPITLAMTMVSLSVYVKLLLFFSVIGFMFFEHIRRCHLLGISSWMTITWVAYRITALSFLILLINNNLL